MGKGIFDDLEIVLPITGLGHALCQLLAFKHPHAGTDAAATDLQRIR